MTNRSDTIGALLAPDPIGVCGLGDAASPTKLAADAALAALLVAVDPVGTGGAVLRAGPGPLRDCWLALLHRLLPPGTPIRRLPVRIEDDRLLGGLDLAATLRSGRPVVERGLLAEVDGGIVVVAMAERVEPGLAARLAAVLDQGSVSLERDGLAQRLPARIALVALDESTEEEDGLAPTLLDRLAFHLDLDRLPFRDLPAVPATATEVQEARRRLPRIEVAPEIVEGLCEVALACGIGSLRAPQRALAAARALAALGGRKRVSETDTAIAARLVLAARAQILPTPGQLENDRPDPPPDSPRDEAKEGSDPIDPGELRETVLQAVRTALPKGLLLGLGAQQQTRWQRAAEGGRTGRQRSSPQHGRPTGTRQGRPGSGAHLALVATLRAAAPWQRIRRRAGTPTPHGRIVVRHEDLHVRRLVRPPRTTTLFLVDASGSTALHRLAEAKGAIELLLADCYVRRDRIALLAFRGRGAELLLPPTRSLARARRDLAALPGGGATPLASALDAAFDLALKLRRQGDSPVLVLLTDGRANVTRDGSPGRARAESDALAAAARLKATGLASLLVDTAPRPEPRARALAVALGARYLPLPRADAHALSQAVRATLPAGVGERA